MSKNSHGYEQRIGDWRVIADDTGFKEWASDCVKLWGGTYVTRAHFEIRQPQDFVKAIPDRQQVPWVRSEAPDNFLSAPVSPQDL